MVYIVWRCHQALRHEIRTAAKLSVYISNDKWGVSARTTATTTTFSLSLSLSLSDSLSLSLSLSLRLSLSLSLSLVR